VTFVSGRAVSMTDEEFRLLRDYIYEQCGIYLPEPMKFLLERRLRPRLAVFGLVNFREYYRLLKYGRDQHKEFDEVTERITTNETYFFRGESQLLAFSEELVPELVRMRQPPRPIRIWSAGCSSGEEPYTLAMLMKESAAARGVPFEIFGNDISRKVLKMAREAIYRDSSFRQTEARHMERWFERDGLARRLRDEIKGCVTFGHLNLMDEGAMAMIRDVDLVFCRNVMIYFAPESRKRLLDVLFRKLRPGGYLVLGHSESLVNLSTQFELVPLRHDIVYRKPEEGVRR
jgi:chemotaxis protein methyltransferase CheR